MCSQHFVISDQLVESVLIVATFLKLQGFDLSYSGMPTAFSINEYTFIKTPVACFRSAIKASQPDSLWLIIKEDLFSAELPHTLPLTPCSAVTYQRNCVHSSSYSWGAWRIPLVVRAPEQCLHAGDIICRAEELQTKTQNDFCKPAEPNSRMLLTERSHVPPCLHFQEFACSFECGD